jgi:hypothetical protein
MGVEPHLEVNSLGDIPKAKPTTNQLPILSNGLDLAVSDTVRLAPLLTFAKFVLEARVAEVFTSKADAIDDVRSGMTAGVIDKAFLETGGCGVLNGCDQVLAVGLLTGNLVVSHGEPRLFSRYLSSDEQIATAPMIEVGLNGKSWLLGVAFDTEPRMLLLEFGPLYAVYERDELIGGGLGWGWTVLRVTVERFKLDVRLDIDLNYWAIGYAAADWRDHGVYFGPINVQIEIDKFYQERNFVNAWVEINT